MPENPSPSSVSPASAGEGEFSSIGAIERARKKFDRAATDVAQLWNAVEPLHARIAALEAENAAQSKQLKDLFDLLLTVESLKRAAKLDGEVDELSQAEEIAEVFAAAKHARVTHFNVYAEQPKRSHDNAWEDEDA